MNCDFGFATNLTNWGKPQAMSTVLCSASRGHQVETTAMLSFPAIHSHAECLNTQPSFRSSERSSARPRLQPEVAPFERMLL